ncbi:hypothetical protein CFK38_15155 [Brachybacterium vulturis]|uniref:PH domain-containing protein n=1 Tax=Brachybacterium vulturis TaxID=2017484 RepID=A0A291GR67_9MICO|nr:hypothetical protein [Brachybacterium vulturis]ATG52715.1 hypothetical protein CFK38_15155 [Brachybacterium vulturis]
MTDPRTPDDAAPAPAPRRTRNGQVVVGPTLRARYVPAALIGLPLVAVLLSPFAGAGIQQWRSSRLHGGHEDLLVQILEPAAVQLLLGALALWVLFALWALIPLLLTHRVVLLDERAGTLALHRGLRVADRATLAQVRYATGDAERGGLALIGVEGGAGTDGEELERQWVVPESGWDAAAFDGLRTLQAAAGLRPAPSRAELVRENRRSRRERSHRELAARLGMPWREEYADDEAAFQAEFDRVRRVLGGRERPREGDPRP